MHYIEIFLSDEQKTSRGAIVSRVSCLGGQLKYEEAGHVTGVAHGICLTFEFEAAEQAAHACGGLKKDGLHVEGPYEY